MADETGEYSKGGSAIYRHERVGDEGASTPAVEVDEATARAIESHFERHFGPLGMVWHELVSDTVHIDVHVVPPTPTRNSTVLFTSGMSALPMNVPKGAEEFRFAELMVMLPADWKLDQAAFEDERWYWPVRWLKMLARLPHTYDSWIGFGHTIPNGEPPEPFYPGCPFVGVLTVPPITVAPDALAIDTDRGPIRLYAVVPLHRDEMDFKLAEGLDPLLDRFDAASVNELVDPKRASVIAKRKKWFGLF